jgi:nucleotide-binding universal stress UspA family protein
MFKKLLVPLDRSPLAEQAIGQAVAIARASHAAVDVVLVNHPVPYSGFDAAPLNEALWKVEHKYIETITDEISSGGVVPATHSIMSGDVVGMICQRAHDVDADLVVMTSHGRTGLSRAWLGSVADGVLRRSAIPVLMLHPVETTTDRRAAHHLFKRILVPLDGSALSMEILASAAALARCSNARILLLRVVQPVPLIALDVDMALMYPPLTLDEVLTARVSDEAGKYLADVKRTLAKEGITDVETHVMLGGRVPQVIIDFAHGHDVSAIAMSTRGRGASRLFVGSVADKVLRASGLPILLQHPIGVSEEPSLLDAESVAEQLPALAHASA